MPTIRLIEDLVRHEGLKLKPYYCSAGKLTIAVGRNLIDRGISKDEAMMMLRNDIAVFTEEARAAVLCFDALGPRRQDVLINMAFNLGTHGLLQFKGMLKALEAGDYETAAKEMLASQWAGQVKGRALELAAIMRAGE